MYRTTRVCRRERPSPERSAGAWPPHRLLVKGCAAEDPPQRILFFERLYSSREFELIVAGTA